MLTNSILLQIEQSDPYKRLRERFAGASYRQPSESWVEDGNTYVVYDLVSEHDLPTPPLTLFVLSNNPVELLMVRTITPTQDLTEVEAVDLYIKKGEPAT